MAIVNVDWEVVESVDDVTKIYKKALARADEADEPAIRIEMAEAQAQFWQRQSEQQSLRVAKREALDKYPLASAFADDLRGSTPQEIEATAKRFHERMEKATADAAAAKQAAAQQQQDIQQQAQQGYGQPAAGGGGATGRVQGDLTSAEEAIQRVHAKLQKGEGLQRSGDKMDAIIMANERLRQAIEFQRVPHPELNLGTGGSYRGELAQDRKLVDARVEARKQARRAQ